MTNRLKLLVLVLVVSGAASAWRALRARPRGQGTEAYLSALEARVQGDTGRSLASLRAAVAAEPQNGEYLAELGETYQAAGQIPEAVAALQAAAFLAPQYPHVYCRLAQALVDDRRRAEALEALDVALRQTPRCPLALSVRAEQFLRDDNLTGALTAFQQVIEVQPDFVLAYQKIGYIHLETSRPDAAIPPLEKGLRLQPAHPGLHFLLAQAYARKSGDAAALRQAEQHYLAAAVRNPEVVQVRSALGQLYLRQGRLRDARQQLEQALLQAPYTKDALFSLAQVAEREGQPREAARHRGYFREIQSWERELAELEARAAARPEDGAARVRIAARLLDKGLHREALKFLDQAVRLDPARRSARELRARAYDGMGEADRASAEYRVAGLLPAEGA